MVQFIERARPMQEFPETAPTANPVFYRTYSRRRPDGTRETWQQVCDRTVNDIAELGQFSAEERALVDRMQRSLRSLSSGRALWVMGTDWIHNPENFSGAYNCTSTNVTDWRAFGLMMDLAMMGCGTGAVLEPKYIDQLPAIRNPMRVTLQGEVGTVPIAERSDETQVQINGHSIVIRVGDSRRGWVDSYQRLLELSSDPRFEGELQIRVDLSNVRPVGEPLKGFGGVANPIKLSGLYERCAAILNRAVGRKLNSVECCLLIDEAAVTIVAGNIRRSAGMRQFDSEDQMGATAKDNLWQQGEDGNWRIDPERDALRMANHTRVFHRKPSQEDCIEAVRKQFYSGEGAIQWAGEAIARANRDLVSSQEEKSEFLKAYVADAAKNWLQAKDPSQPEEMLDDRISRYGLNPCLPADTWIHTGAGPRQIKDLIGIQHKTYVNGELFETTPEGFFYTGTKPVLRIETQEGYSLRLTGNHQVLTEGNKWIPAEELQPGDRIVLHDHYGQVPWDGQGTFEEGRKLGLRFAGLEQEPLLIGSSRSAVSSRSLTQLEEHFRVAPSPYEIIPEIEVGSFAFYRGFLQGFCDGNAYVDDEEYKISIAGELRCLTSVQRMLLRLGVSSQIKTSKDMSSFAGRSPAPFHGEFEEEAIRELVIQGRDLFRFQRMIGFQDPETFVELRDLLLETDGSSDDGDHFIARVTRTFPDGEEKVYDCTVPGANRFDANGFVVHNCGEILGSDFHCVSGDTILITRDGMHRIQDLVGQSVEIWNGQRWSQVIPIQTGRDRKLYRVRFGDGTHLDVTDKHRFFVKHRFQKEYQEVTTAELADRIQESNYVLHTEPFRIDYREGNHVDPTYAYTLGQLVGDGSICQSNGKPQLRLRLYGLKQEQELTIAGTCSGKRRYYTGSKEVPCLLYVGFQGKFDPLHVRALKDQAKPFDEMASWDRESILHFVAGLADADGSETSSGGIRIYLSDYERAYRVYLLLLKCGIRSSVNLMALAGHQTNLGERKKDLWYLQISECNAIPCQRLDTTRGHQPRFKGKHQSVRSVEPLEGSYDTFCFNEPEFHKGVFGGTLTGQCNLSEVHLNQIDPHNEQEQKDAFTAGALSVAALLNHQFREPRYQYSRSIDPIVGVSFTGLFDFFVNAFGVGWLRWWQEGRPETVEGLRFKERECQYLSRWSQIVHETVWEYCDRHGLRRPNRCTTVQPSGTKSLLTGASPGWHPPKAQRYIRRITFGKNDPVALACLEYGYSIVPSQSDKDENGNLLNDPFDPRCTEWLVELPVEVPWANLPGASEIPIESFSALAQFDFYLQVQKFYTTHNTSATIELREDEIEALGEQIHRAIQEDQGYISAALLARFDAPFPRLPFEKIDKETYDRMSAEVLTRRRSNDFLQSLVRYDEGFFSAEGPAGCDAMGCLMPESSPQS